MSDRATILQITHPQADYFENFTAYLKSGDIASLQTLFEPGSDLGLAAVYRNGVLRSCADALKSNYPTVLTLVGEDYFDFLAAQYFDTAPPTQSSLAVYGRKFPDLLETFAEQHQLAYLPSFALLDQAWGRAYFAPDTNPMRNAEIDQWLELGRDMTDLPLQLVDSAQMVSVKFDIVALWETLKSSRALNEATQIQPADTAVLMWRDDSHTIQVNTPDRAMCAFLEPLFSGCTLLQAASHALAVDAHFDVRQYFSTLLHADLLGSSIPETQEH